MIRISTIFIAICMVLVAASLGLVLYSVAGISGSESAIVALTALTFLILYNAVSMRLRDRTDLGGQIADDQALLLGLKDGFGRVGLLADKSAVVVEAQFRAEALGAEFIFTGSADAQARFGRGLNRLNLKLRRKIKRGQMLKLEHLVEQFVGLREGNNDRFLVAKQEKPVVGIVMIQEGESVVENHQPTGGGEKRSSDWDLLFAANQNAGEDVVLGGFIPAGLHAELPRAGIVEMQIAQLVGIGFGKEHGAAGAADHGKKHPLERVRNAIRGIVGKLEFVARCAAFEEGENLLIGRIGEVREIGEG